MRKEMVSKRRFSVLVVKLTQVLQQSSRTCEKSSLHVTLFFTPAIFHENYKCSYAKLLLPQKRILAQYDEKLTQGFDTLFHEQKSDKKITKLRPTI